jgi:hypothetical protein
VPPDKLALVGGTVPFYTLQHPEKDTKDKVKIFTSMKSIKCVQLFLTCSSMLE